MASRFHRRHELRLTYSRRALLFVSNLVLPTALQTEPPQARCARATAPTKMSIAAASLHRPSRRFADGGRGEAGGVAF